MSNGLSKHKIIIGCLEDLDYKKTSPYSTSAAVINCLTGKGEERIVEGKPCLEMQLYDDFPISYYAFDIAIEFINKCIDKGDVLICCESGTSRSVAVGIAYYLSRDKTLPESLKLIGKGRPARIHNASLLSWACKKGYISEEEREKFLY